MEVMRPFSKAVELTNTTKTIVNLKDTNGDLVKCNYVALSTSSVNNDVFVSLALHISGLTTPPENVQDLDGAGGMLLSPDASGFCGILKKCTKNISDIPDEIFLSDSDRVDAVTLQASDLGVGGSVLCMLYYGQIQHSNDLRSSFRDIGA